MRDDSLLESEAQASETGATWKSGAATAIGAVLSLAILAAVIVWSYRLGVRDADDVPVIRAQTEATKAKPDDPGGIDVEHQDRAVYGVVSGAEAPAAEPGFAPAAESLAAEDVAPVAAAPAPAPRPEAPEETQAASVAEPAETATTEAETAATEAAPAGPTAIAAPAPAARPGPAPTAEAPRPSTPAAPIPSPAPITEAPAISIDPAPEAAEETLAALGPAPRAAPAARARPNISARVAPQAETPEPRAAALASRVQIQLGAFNSEEIAAAQWAAAKTRNGDLLAGRGRVITPVVSGGRRLYRLRAGPFSTVNEASTLCRALIGRGEDCIVATN